MLKLRLKRYGRKKKVFYRIVLINIRSPRDGLAIEELGFYDPINKLCQINKGKAIFRLQQGAQPTLIVRQLLQKLKIIY